MNQNIVNLEKEFERIKNKGWIKEVTRGKGSVGYTFEAMLKKRKR